MKIVAAPHDPLRASFRHTTGDVTNAPKTKVRREAQENSYSDPVPAPALWSRSKVCHFIALAIPRQAT